MNSKELPEEFLAQQERLLGEEYPEYLASFAMPWNRGLRVNTWKLSPERFLTLSPFPLEPVPWIPNGFYYDSQWTPAKDPYYYAGLYYLQEPSAMTPAAFLPVKPGDKVLDLCAAPGGKATELGARLKGKGLLFANDISNSRAKGLLKNLELFGIPNICVTSESPETLSRNLPEFFDCILADAPCSGEGMFRKEPGMVKDWKERGPEYYAPIQREILTQAERMLKPGGYLLYSTCTFSPMEDEENAAYVFKQFPWMELEPLPRFPGAADGFGLSGVLRLFPHRVKGEGHFLALFRKKSREGTANENLGQAVLCGDGLADGCRKASLVHSGLGGRKAGDRSRKRGAGSARDETLRKTGKSGNDGNAGNPPELYEFAEFMENLSFPLESGRLRLMGENLFYLPEHFPEGIRFRYLRTGLWLGTVKRGRFEPSQSLAMAVRAEDYAWTVRLSREDERVFRYLKGETLTWDKEEPGARIRGAGDKGWRLVCVEDFPLGWAKEDRGMLKNKYYPGWRY